MSCVSEEKGNQYIVNDTGHKLFCKCWTDDTQKPRALLFICHGLAEHCLCYDEIATSLSKQGFYVFAHDHVGHGQSEGSRCLIEDLHEYTRDVFKHIDQVKEQFPNLPVFILGHSMGGAVSILAAIEQPHYFKGVALIGPVVTPEQDTVGPVRIFVGKLIARVCPQFPVLWLKSSEISRDPIVCQRYEDDPLVYHGGMKARTGLAILRAVQEIESNLERIEWPFIVCHGGHDKIISPQGSKTLYEKAASKDKTIKIYNDCFHQVHGELEPNKSTLFQEISDWFCKRI